MPRFGVDIGAVGNFIKRLSGDTVADYVKSPEFMEKVVTGYKQQSAGEDPTGLIEAQNDLVGRGWGPKTSANYINGLIERFERARQQ